jgi:4-hydroxybenzoate polyprenyltransferase
MLISLNLGKMFALVTFAYLCLNVAYNMALKKMYLIDVFTISLGMVLRAIAGCVVIGVFISPWLILCTFLISVYLAFGKRRHELLIMNETADNHRIVLRQYSVRSLDIFLNCATSSIIVCYTLYTFFSNHIYMMLTIPFALYGIFKYTDHIYNKQEGGEPELMFKDTAIIIDILLWITVVILVLFGLPEAIIARI